MKKGPASKSPSDDKMQIEQELLEQLNISEYTVKERLFSKKNEVYKIEALRGRNKRLVFIYKIFINSPLQNEYQNLLRLESIRVPRVLARGENALALEYLNGRTLLKSLELLEKRKIPFDVCIHALVDFLESFYNALPGYIYEDINLRNFITMPRGVYGIDLEEARPGEKERDAGRMAAFLLTYAPANTEYKKNAARTLIKEFVLRLGLDEALINDEMEKEFACMKMRRANKEGVAGDNDRK